MNENCAFCRIVDGNEHAHYVYEDEHTAAFLDSNPAIEGHTLIVPKVHSEGLVTLDEKTSNAVFQTVRTVAVAIDQVLDPNGFSVVHSTGSLVGNVEHAHVHLFPRTTDDNIRISLSRQKLAEKDAKQLTAHIRANL